ncbi:SusC/RagA family TonB-linked outer membrane protein [Arenibacter palladensis]|uniref:SusC/RagA family TonB-linked outer membrane protein n=1 Tax=Arenibacter palladensis TaxID=237373 RepID=UPI0026E2518E|nr:SusC/RagA family TonB-linked outer membrane protein [Arenibacter palladensis]MDO6605198.1 SusC/RagA family TonB-linked outer membrane protein [Arenibacter palladensis]
MKNIRFKGWLKPIPFKMTLKMKLTTILLIVSLFKIQANSYSQNTKLSLDYDQISIGEVFKEIERKSEFRFLYKNKELDSRTKVSIHISKGNIYEILNRLFKELPIKYEVLDNRQIILSKQLPKIKTQEEGIPIGNHIEQISVSGSVVDANGTPLPGANVVEKGTINGVTVDFDGHFSIEVADGNATLVISYIGFSTKEVEVNGQNTLNITLEESAAGLDEVVVVGYGTARRKDISGAVTTVRLEDSPIALSSNTNALQALKGTASGVNIGVQNSPGTAPGILVRGQNSINGSNDPLIVLDGIIYLGSMTDINTDDISTIDILKDASAAAVYGSRAANGVVVITTKKGKTDKPIITYNTSVGVNTWQDKFDMMDRERWTEKFIAQTTTVNSPEEIVPDGAYHSDLWQQKDIETNWMDLISRNGFNQNHQIAVSGRSDRINYYFSGGYTSNEGAIIGDDYQRVSLRTKMDVDVTDWLEVGIDGTYNNNDYSGVRAALGNNVYQQITWAYPYRFEGMPVNASANTGTLLERFPTGSSINNPLWGTDGTIKDIDTRDFYRLSSYALINVPKVDGLTYRFNFSINSNYNEQDRFVYEDYYVGEAGVAPYLERYSPGELAKRLSQANGFNNRTKSYAYVMDNIVNYKKEFGEHYLDGTLVMTRDFSKSKLVRAIGSDYSVNGNTLLGVDGIHKAAIQNTDINVVEKANVGYVGRLGYAYNDKYHLTATIRKDGASVFGEDQKWGNFQSLGVAWTISEEDFVSGLEKLNYMKIKASYGKNGNQGLAPYQTLAQVDSGNDGGIRYEFGDAPSTILYGVEQSNLGSPSLGWETTTAFNGGFESSWLNNRVFFDLDFYFSETSDQIFERQIPTMTGFSSIFSSLGQVNNKGVEISLRTINVSSENLKWSSGINFWQNRNKVISLYGDDNDGDGKEDDDIANDLFIGKSLGAIYGYKYIGVVQEDDIEYIANVGAKPGDPMFKDISGPAGVPDGVISADYDREILGYRKENFTLSLSNTVEYKNFSLYVMISGIFGGGKDNFYLRENQLRNSFKDRYWTNEIDHEWWTPENKSEKYLRANAYDSRYLGLQSRSFVKIQDINLSYKLPRQYLSGIGLNSLELYTSVKNQFTFTNWYGGGDPEAGIRPDDNTPPVPTIYTMGLKLRF